MFAISVSESFVHWGGWILAKANVLGLKIWWCPFFCFLHFPLNFKVKSKFSISLLNFWPLGFQNHISPLPYVSCVSNICCVFREYRWFSRLLYSCIFLFIDSVHISTLYINFFLLLFWQSWKCLLPYVNLPLYLPEVN